MAKLRKGVNDFKTWCEQNGREDLLAEWDYEKNDDLLPENITIGSQRMIWWIGSCGHSWDIRLGTRIKLNTKCPFCTGKRVLSGFNDLATTHPKLAAEWNHEKNKGLKNKKGSDISTPDKVMAGSNQQVWWIGKCGHEWPAVIASRAKQGVGCPKCNNELHTSFNEQAIFYYLRKYYPDAINGDKTAIGMELDIYIPSIRVAIEYDGAIWHKNTTKDKKKNTACKNNGISLIRIREGDAEVYDDCICIIRKDIRSKTTLNDVIMQVFSKIDTSLQVDINTQRDEASIRESYMLKRKANSLAILFPELASEWHPEKNGSLTPDKVISGSMQTAWWLGKCGHEWPARVAHRITGVGCPYCNISGTRVLVGFNDFETWCKLNGREDLLKEWDYSKNKGLKNGFNEDISTPDRITEKSSQIVWWMCDKGHEYDCSVDKRVTRNFNCPYCSNHRLLVGFNDLASRYPIVASEWHPIKNTNLTPDKVLFGSGTEVWWLGKCGHEWQDRIVDRTTGNMGCPYCRPSTQRGVLGVRVMCIETGIIYDNLAKAAEDMHTHKASIVNCCKGRQNKAGGFHWKYID